MHFNVIFKLDYQPDGGCGPKEYDENENFIFIFA